jgi:hypothetical protein
MKVACEDFGAQAEEKIHRSKQQAAPTIAPPTAIAAKLIVSGPELLFAAALATT